jgi:hypothetical protein
MCKEIYLYAAAPYWFLTTSLVASKGLSLLRKQFSCNELDMNEIERIEPKALTAETYTCVHIPLVQVAFLVLRGFHLDIPLLAVAAFHEGCSEHGFYVPDRVGEPRVGSAHVVPPPGLETGGNGTGSDGAQGECENNGVGGEAHCD